MSLFSKKKDKKRMTSKLQKLKRCTKRLKRSLLTIEEDFDLSKEEKNKKR